MLVTGKATPKAPSKPQEPAYRSSLADMPSHMAEAVRLSQERRAAQFLADNLIQLAHKIGCFMQDSNEMRERHDLPLNPNAVVNDMAAKKCLAIATQLIKEARP